jgi:hypothetical protein
MIKTVRSKEIPFITKAIDKLFRNISKEKLSYKELVGKFNENILCMGEINHTFHSIGAPINTYKILGTQKIKKNLEESIDFISNQEYNTPLGDLNLELTSRKKRKGMWYHINVIGSDMYPKRVISGSIDLFTV